ncbi:MAG: ABC transporter ATP-binding protein [Victivallales bacterium]|nr:ABC transporter ATP-binding protein [Victivallales bacterium]
MGMLLNIVDVSKTYRSSVAGGIGIKILDGLSMELESGATVAVTAPSGTGKSTLLNLVGGIDRPDSGSIIFKGKDIAKFTDDELAAYRNRHVGFVFQEHHLLPQCTAIENVLLPTLPAVSGGSESGVLDRAMFLLERVGLADRTAHFPGQLSGGERQRVALARGLINSPALLLADEPTGSLDRANAEKLADLMMEINSSTGTAIIIATHSEALASKASRHLLLADGNLRGCRA